MQIMQKDKQENCIYEWKTCKIGESQSGMLCYTWSIHACMNGTLQTS